MKGKKDLGRVLLSVVIATLMISIPASVFASQQVYTPNNNTPNNNNNNGNTGTPTFKEDIINSPPAPTHIVPNGDVYFSEDFSTFNTAIWSIANNSGDGNYSYNATNGWMDWLVGTNTSDTENDYLNASVNLTTIPTCVYTVNLQFEAWGDGATVWIEFDSNVLGNVSVTTKTAYDFDITTLATPAVHVLTFHVNDNTSRNFHIDNITISANYKTDIIINGIEGMVNGGRYNTFPKTIRVNVTNKGMENITDADFHLQIYKEQPYSPEMYYCWDMEACAAKDWAAISHDGDSFTWTWTTVRSHSPSHSFGSHPDSLKTYEANSNDELYLVKPFYVPSVVNDKTVHAAFLNFSYWVQGEFDGTNPIDYGYVVITNGTYNVTSDKYYDSNGNWLYDNIDISPFIGQDVTIHFFWISDDYINNEGMYVDDVCIQLAYTSAQPLVMQGYKYVDLPANSTKTIQFPIDFVPENDTTYFLQVYSDYKDCIPDNHHYGHGYADEINWTIYFGDICDAAITDVTVDRYFEMPHSDGYVNIPINATVYNNGTLTEDVPVKVAAYQKITEKMWSDDVESGDKGYSHPEWGTSSHWNIVDFDFYSPYHAWYFGDATTHTYGAGGATAFELTPEGTVDWNLLKTAADADVVVKLKWDLAPGDMIVPIMVNGNSWWFFVHYSVHLTGNSGGWQEIRMSDLLAGYVAGTGVKNIFYLPDAYGFTDFRGFGIGIYHSGWSLAGGAGGVLMDNILVYRAYQGSEVWSTVYTVNSLAPSASTTFQTIWNASEYGDYIISANVQLPCDQDSSNNEGSALTTIQEHLFTDASSIGCDDNTYGKADDWHIVSECSVCPQGHFWWNGVDADGTYDVNRNDILQIDKTFNFTGVTEAYLNFTDKYWIENGWDYGYVEVSNDSGMTWFILDKFTGDTSGAWVNVSEHLVPGTTQLTSPYTGFTFLMPANFFTANMHFRFRFYSDEAVVEKGWYIDDVSLNINNGTWNVIFSDNMENGDANWIHMMEPYGCHWHAESTFGAPAPTSSWYWNGENRSWIGTGVVNYTDYLIGDGFWAPWWSMDDNAGGAWNGWYFWWGINGERGFDMLTPGPSTEDDWLNITLDLSTASSPYIEFVANSTTPGITYWVTITNGTLWQNYSYALSAVDTWEMFHINIPSFGFSTTPVTIGFHVNGTFTYANVYLWRMWVNATAPTVPYGHYYNNVDEKLIFQFDLTHVYHATLEWDQNFSFADLYPDDYGVVEISTDSGSTWKALFIVQGNSGNAWGHMSLDISDYVGGDVPVLVRFRFISNSGGTDYGWLIDNVGIIGWSDYKNPTVTAALDPATPDGCNGWYKSPVTVTLTANDNVKVATIYYRIDGGAWKIYTAPITINVDGSHTVDYYSVDEVGNPSTTGTVSFKIDTTAPTSSITFPEAGYIYVMGRQLFKNPLGGTFIIGKMTFKADASDATSGVDYVHFDLGNGFVFDDSSSPYEVFWNNFDLLPTKYTLTVTATDYACNTGAEATLSFTHWL